jgi:hypothetical protein
MKEFALFNDSFSATKTTTYHLSILLSRQGYSYCIVDTVRQKCVVIKNVNFDLVGDTDTFYKNVEDLLKNDSFLNKFYKSVDFIYQSSKSTLVPNALFNRKKLKSYFEFNQSLDPYEEIHYNKLKRTEAINIFSIPSSITTLMVNQFPELNFYHQASTFIDNTLRKAKETGNIVGVMVNENFFDLAVCESGKLFLYNNFPYQNENDFVYHILNVYQQLKIEPSKVPLALSGDIHKDDNRFKLLLKFIKEIQFVRITDNSNCQYSFNEIPEHFLSNLLNIE